LTKILIAEADQSRLGLYKRILKEINGFYISAAESKSALLTAYEKAESFDALVIDMDMAKAIDSALKGKTLESILKSKKGIPKIPIIAISRDPADFEAAKALGAEYFIRRPFDSNQELSYAVAQVTSSATT